MVKKLVIVILIYCYYPVNAQNLYFPPITGTAWDTLSPASLGWCQPSIDSLYSYLQQTHTTAFILLKDGKIVLEKYFGNFTADSVHYWASAGKSLVGMLTGMAQEKGLLNINNPVTNYLGSGWTVAPPNKEGLITVRHLLSMTSGLNDLPLSPCDNESTGSSCLQYLVDAGTRWAYHTGAYQQLASVISAVSGSTINQFTNTNIGLRTGMTGLWVNGVYYSKTRSMARFGLLALSGGIWGNDTLLHDAGYFGAMTNSSQSFNPAYGYLWWLNGKASYMSPGLQFVFPGSLVPKAPPDMYAALGKNDQKIYVVPSQKLVVVRTGESSYGVPLAFSPFDDLLWGKIDSLDYRCNYRFTGNGNWNQANNWMNNSIPPPVLQKSASIFISPVAGGECVLNVSQTIGPGTSLIVPANAKFRIIGKLEIVQH